MGPDAMGLLRPLRIGDVRIPNNLVLSPMAGFTDLAFRVLCRRHGAGLVSSEMVAAGSVGREAPHPRLRSRTNQEERPTSIQMFGTEPDVVAAAARSLGELCDVLGFNMGCPAHQIRRQGCGAALLDDPARCESIVKAVKKASPTPLLVKMRAGNEAAMDVVAFARRLESAGADGIIFHARTARQNYSGRADWSLIRAVKEAVSVPVIGNGDIVDGPSAERALRESGADGIAIGRAALGDPRLFGRIAAFLESGFSAEPPSWRERREDFLAYLGMALDLGYDRARILQQAHRFTRGLRGGADLRARLTEGALGPDAIREAFASFSPSGIDAASA